MPARMLLLALDVRQEHSGTALLAQPAQRDVLHVRTQTSASLAQEESCLKEACVPLRVIAAPASF